MLGQTYNVQPVPPDPQRTRYFDFGVLRIGVEYRNVDPAALADAYDGDDLAEVELHSPDGGFTDEGLSIHVISAEDDHEYLRFDAFDDEPHYHYVDKVAGTNTVVGFDVAAHGPAIPWAVGQLRNRLTPMLRHAGATNAAEAISPDTGHRSAATLEEYLPTIGIDISAESTNGDARS